jgi:quercetin dioxygenase-like cupin family protein
MLTRRGIAGCALCAVTGFFAESVRAETAQPAPTNGIKRTILMQTDGPAEGYVTVLVGAEIPAGSLVARHTHPGIESAYAIEGGGVLTMDGQADKTIGQGDSFQVPARVPHAFQNGAKATRLHLTMVLEKGKPLASPA